MHEAAKKSPYLQDAADALRELRAREKEAKKLRNADADTLRHYLYIRNVLMNPQAADAYLTDYDETRELLSKSAGSLRVGDHPLMRERELRRINFIRHDYFLVYHIEGDEAEIVAVGHFDEDLKNVIH